MGYCVNSSFWRLWGTFARILLIYIINIIYITIFFYFSQGLRQFIMDTVSGNSPGNNNKLIGSVEIPLSSVPASGLNKWWNLEKQPEKVIFPFFCLFASKLIFLLHRTNLRHKSYYFFFISFWKKSFQPVFKMTGFK